MDNEKLTPEAETNTASEVIDNAPIDIPVVEAEATAPNEHEDDIDAALASVASLSDVLAEQALESEIQTAEFTAVDLAPPAPVKPQARPRLFPTPPASTLPRGSMASVVPALLLIGAGAWLTFAYSTNTPPEPVLIFAVALGGMALTLVARWVSAGRWARGTLFIVAALLLSALVLGFVAISGAMQFYPLLLTAVGTAFWLTAQLARPRDLRLMFPGSLLVVSGIIGTVVTSGVLGTDLLNIAASFWYVPLIILAILWLIPLLRRGR
jgi:hypothetical protein